MISKEICWSYTNTGINIIDNKNNKTIVLDKNGAMIFDLLSKKYDIDNIIINLVNQFGKEFETQIKKDVHSFIQDMRHLEILA
ncbi:PqqD family protein [Clostridium argentinense]|uniref:PqqD family protein n=1 Tax=Clostridium argentinense TaxID=29341 RepID=UPI0013D522FA|nr:PqqD family protein [Clostridium argentinense]NFF39790.1 PqqD family protein [Clostridium argentinense]